jgi:hypothetical protein
LDSANIQPSFYIWTDYGGLAGVVVSDKYNVLWKVKSSLFDAPEVLDRYSSDLHVLNLDN